MVDTVLHAPQRTTQELASLRSPHREPEAGFDTSRGVRHSLNPEQCQVRLRAYWELTA